MNTEEIIIRRLLDLAKRAEQRSIITYSDFLSDGDISLFLSKQKDFSFVNYNFYGGREESERNMIAFIPKDNCYSDLIFPITCIEIQSTYKKFAEQLSHRDYLGAILNLGIERSLLGDILVTNQATYLFCKDSIASFILGECTRIRHTVVTVREIDFYSIDYEQQYTEIAGTVSSLRIDSIVSVCTKISRSKSVDLIHGEKVFCNHRLITSPHFSPGDNDIISIRGYGKFRIDSDSIKETKKGRYYIKILKYA